MNSRKNAYLNYSMYVIMDRALPFYRGWPEAVQRRIVYVDVRAGAERHRQVPKSPALPVTYWVNTIHTATSPAKRWC